MPTPPAETPAEDLLPQQQPQQPRAAASPSALPSPGALHALSAEERRAMIQQVLAAKRANASAPGSPELGATPDVSAPASSQEPPAAAAADAHAHTHAVRPEPPVAHMAPASALPQRRESYDSVSMTSACAAVRQPPSHQHSQEASQQQQLSARKLPSYTEPEARLTARERQLLRDPKRVLGELADCTFQPEVHPSPKPAEANLPNFDERVQQWRVRKAKELEHRAAQEAQREVEQCTFQPQINPASRRIAAVRGRQSTATHERLYRDSTASHRWSVELAQQQQLAQQEPTVYVAGTSLPAGAQPAQQTLRTQQPGRRSNASSPGDRPPPAATYSAQSTPRRGRHAPPPPPTALAREERELAECTFQPQINPRSARAISRVKARIVAQAQGGPSTGGPGSSGAGGQQPVKPPAAPSGTEECTFRPRTNALRKDMKVAASYASKNVHERLYSRAQSRGSQSAQRGDAARAPRSQSAARRRRRSSDAGSRAQRRDSIASGASVPPMEVDAFLAEVESAGSVAGGPRAESRPKQHDRRQSFSEFIARQEAAAQRRESVQSGKPPAGQNSPSFAPALCKRSLDMINPAKHGTFFDRVTQSSVRREQAAIAAQAAKAADPECTFKPSINRVSAKRPARTVSDMSTGDALKRATAQRLMKLKAEQDELSGVTFQPELSSAGKQSKGKLRLRDDPSSFLRRVAAAKAAADERAALARQCDVTAEMSECTFQPETHDAPEYIKRIAKSVALSKALTPAVQESKRPDWK